MATQVCEVPINSLMSQCTVTLRLTGVKRWKVRFWIGRKLLFATVSILARLTGIKLKLGWNK